VFDQSHPLASGFLAVSCAFFLAVYAVPLLFFPLRWARWFRWEPGTGSPHLTVYFGRCTGGLALAIIALAIPAIRDPGGHRFVFDLIAWATGIMTLVHLWGAVRRTQPWTEDVEIALYGAVCAVALWIRSTLG